MKEEGKLMKIIERKKGNFLLWILKIKKGKNIKFHTQKKITEEKIECSSGKQKALSFILQHKEVLSLR